MNDRIEGIKECDAFQQTNPPGYQCLQEDVLASPDDDNQRLLKGFVTRVNARVSDGYLRSRSQALHPKVWTTLPPPPRVFDAARNPGNTSAQSPGAGKDQIPVLSPNSDIYREISRRP